MAESQAMIKSRWLKAYIQQKGLLRNLHLYHSFTYQRDVYGGYVVGMAQHITYDYLIGKGKTLDEAVRNIKPVMKTYDERFEALRKEGLKE